MSRVDGLAIKRVRIDTLHEDPANVRKHGQKNMAAIRASLQEFGQVEPLVVQAGSGKVIGGNGRLAAMRALKWEDCEIVEIAVDETQAARIGIALNRTGELAEWDPEGLATLLQTLSDAGELGGVGFDSKDLDALLKDLGGGQDVEEDDDPDAPPETPFTRTGDLWLLGNHRLLCGDSTDRNDVDRLMAGERAQCVFTDPPYGVSIGAKNRMLQEHQKAERRLEDIESDDLSPDDLKLKLLPAFVLMRECAMAEDCTLFVCAPQNGELGMMMLEMLRDAKLTARHVLIWKKNHPTFSMGRLDYDYAHEPILLTWGKRHKRPMLGKFKTSVWEVDRERKCDAHPTMKPVALYANAYLNNSDSGDSVFDAYAGSGTAFAAAEQTNRRCFGMEISPQYCDVIVRRWQKLTGKTATRDGDGAVMPQVNP